MEKVIAGLIISFIHLWGTILIVSLCLTPLVAGLWHVDIEDYEVEIGILFYTAVALFAMANQRYLTD